jgi:hypothetical protein
MASPCGRSKNSGDDIRPQLEEPAQNELRRGLPAARKVTAVSLATELDTVADTLRADGADLSLDGVDAGTARVRLLFGPDTCTDCILPREHLEEVLLAVLSKADPTITAVALADPREEPV